jgi:hypothetical protein
MHGQVAAASSPPRRLSPANTVICIRLKQKYSLPVDSRFELHSVSGFRLQNGTIQIERIAGFCHMKNALKTYWLDQIESMRSLGGEPIDDLSTWLDQRQPELPQVDASGNPEPADFVVRGPIAEPKRQASSVSRSIEKAIDAAAANGFTDIADRLRVIKSLLPDARGNRLTE